VLFLFVCWVIVVVEACVFDVACGCLARGIAERSLSGFAYSKDSINPSHLTKISRKDRKSFTVETGIVL
jgi:hypothetical protein